MQLQGIQNADIIFTVPAPKAIFNPWNKAIYIKPPGLLNVDALLIAMNQREPIETLTSMDNGLSPLQGRRDYVHIRFGFPCHYNGVSPMTNP